MKRNLFLALLAVGLVSSLISEVRADTPFGMGRHRRVGRIEGYWCQPTKGPLFDYSPYFAARYPQLPGAAEFQWTPQPFAQPGNGQVIGPVTNGPAQVSPNGTAPPASPQVQPKP